jgi:2-polyprenyl-3-methyl-5-hydroxy-6-metoxy-1,4-benzoquinol methylase
MSNYDTIATWFMQNRQSQIGLGEAAKLAALLPAGAKVLDLGCGHGIPIAQYLVQHNFEVYAIDSSAKLIAQFNHNFPGIPVECAYIQDSDFFSTTFDAVICYGVLFHLSAHDQRKVLQKITSVLYLRGILLFTASNEAIEGTSQMNGQSFPYLSFGTEAYTRFLNEQGMELLDAYWENHVYVFRKSTTPHR